MRELAYLTVAIAGLLAGLALGMLAGIAIATGGDWSKPQPPHPRSLSE